MSGREPISGILIAKTLVFVCLAPGTVVVLLPYLIRTRLGGPEWPPPQTLRALAATLALAGITVTARCMWDFVVAGRGTPAPIDPPRALVATGLYRVSRNPMYLGVVSILVAEALFFGSLLLAGYAMLVLTAFHLFVVLYEEPTLARLFGESYRRYRREVPRWLPFPAVGAKPRWNDTTGSQDRS